MALNALMNSFSQQSEKNVGMKGLTALGSVSWHSTRSWLSHEPNSRSRVWGKV